MTSKSNLSQHIIDLHKTNKLIKCEECNLAVKQNRLKRHIKEKHENEFICNICKKKYSSNSVLKDHVINVHEETKQKCNKCEKFYKPETLRKHIRIFHDKAYTQSCKLCNQVLSSKGVLKKHLITIHRSEFKQKSISI